MFIAHRINTLEELLSLPETLPIEFDIRDSNGTCIVTHDPFTLGVSLDIFLNHCTKRFLIVNIKSEGIEKTVLEMLQSRNIQSFFILDSTIPVIYKFTNQGEKRFAIRLSEVEPLEFIMRWKNKVEWVWVDCFSKFILTKEVEELLHSSGFKLCLVSPELQGRSEDIPIYSKKIKESSIYVDAICTKHYNIDSWNKSLE